MSGTKWLDQITEEIIDPNQRICDPHHHLWDHPNSAYLLPELLKDINSGHKVVSTVFVECGSMYSVDLETRFAPIGETEFVQGIAAMSSSGQYGNNRIAAGIVSFADMLLGEGVRDVLQAHI
jgi:L-fuconolactonase